MRKLLECGGAAPLWIHALWLSKLTSLLRTAIKNTKARHGAGKRVRVRFRFDEPGAGNP